MVKDGDDSASVNANLFPSGLSHVKVLKRRVAPTPGIVGQGIVGRTEVGGSDSDGGSLPPPLGVGLVVTHDPVTLST